MTFSDFFIHAWDWKPGVLIGCALLLAAGCYGPRFRPSLKLLAWGAGVAILLLALVSPWDALSAVSFSFHMSRHIALVLIVPALLLMGLHEKTAARVLAYRPIETMEAFLNRPAISWLAGIGVMIAWHVPYLFHLAMESEALHILEPLSLLAGGAIFWWPILTPLPASRMQPAPHAIAYLASACLACTMMGVAITFSAALLYPHYLHPADPFSILPLIRNQWGLSVRTDQQTGGLLMWVPCCLVYLTAILGMLARWYAEEQDEPEPSGL